MPSRIAKSCRYRGCKKTTTDKSGYCNDHIGQGWVQYRRGKTRTERGYGHEWDKLRLKILIRDKGLCQNCLAQGRLTKATCVDHIQAKAHGGQDRCDNLRALCERCHLLKTAVE